MNRLIRPALIATLPLLAASAAEAVTIPVNGSTCTLANAINAANSDTATGGCTAGSGVDTITLQADVVLAAALPDISSAVTLEGNGHKIDGNGGSFSVLLITASGNLTLNNAVVTGGNAINDGGGIYSTGTLTLNSCTVRGNMAGNQGGGIDNIDGTLVLNNSTITANSTQFGGGIHSYNSTTTVNNSTISGNMASSLGGGVYADQSSTVTLNSSTISGNAAINWGGGVFVYSSVTTLNGTLISGNSAATGRELYRSSGTVSGTYSLFGHSGETNAQAFVNVTPNGTNVTATSDGTQPTAQAAVLGPLTNNGGSTLTYSLPAGSPALDLNPTCAAAPAFDQRGYSRPRGAGCDAGAFEAFLLPATTWRMTAASCTPAPADIVSQYSSDIPGGSYGTNWIGYKWEVATQSYVVMQSTDPLLLGEGNWLYSTIPATLTVTGTETATEPCSNYGSGLSGSCFAISLNPSSNSWQMVGHPFPYSVSWADVRVASYNGSLWTQRTPSQAKTANIIAKEQWRWIGSTYEAKDDVTPTMIGTLLPQEAVWVRMLPGSVGSTVKLLIPAR